jgi:hypothetical protein
MTTALPSYTTSGDTTPEAGDRRRSKPANYQPAAPAHLNPTRPSVSAA